MSKCLNFDVSIKLVGIMKMEYIRRNRRKRTVWLTVINSAILQAWNQQHTPEFMQLFIFWWTGTAESPVPLTPRLSVYFLFCQLLLRPFEGCLSIPSLRLCFHPRLKTLLDLSRVLDLGKIIRTVLQSTGTHSQFKHSWSECRGGSYSYIYLPNSLLISSPAKAAVSPRSSPLGTSYWSRYLRYSQVFVRTLIGFTFACTLWHTVEKLSADYLYIILLFSLLVYL